MSTPSGGAGNGDPRFRLSVYQNEFLPEGGTEVHAVVTVSAEGTGNEARHGRSPSDTPPGAVVIMIDCSGSMNYPATKLQAARQATAAAIDTVRDGVAFAVVAGTHEAREIYPGSGRMAVADEHTRAAAKHALRRLHADGGTAIGTWLKLAKQLLTPYGSAVRHAILLTDGKNEHEDPATLQATLEECQGWFTCDCRGIGTDWEVSELRRVAGALLGSVDIVADPAGLQADFEEVMARTMAKEVPDVYLRVWTPKFARLVYVKQVAPTIEDLTDRRIDVDPRNGDYPTGSWGDEERDYHICVQVPAQGVNDELAAARVSLVTAGPDGSPQVLTRGLVRAVWTDDLELSTRMNSQVVRYTGEAEIAEAIQQGIQAKGNGDFEEATAKLGRAVQLVHAAGNTEKKLLLDKVVEIIDPANGTVRLRTDVSREDDMTLDVASTRTVHRRPHSGPGAGRGPR
ncbi:VWA domain-containing protein [Allostreptomyces psammosilenae]|uniref:VWFA domain-containing protein n=1 Tax=Allostreptomyces psammosilenae TaxID=1892865 RepID=A0A853A1C5_9ACTN|nr:VWA domain-containing protein [Allostreptomyces psammosilenae]NYI08366.1 hypothetical protein [Allostreptomyces psammosilenae]